MGDSITIKVKTLSNLFIGGAPAPFEIGGIDQRTAVDEGGFPYIPASSFKGALRTMVREDRSDKAEEIKQLFAAYLTNEQEKNWPQIQKLVQDQDVIKRIEERFERAKERLSAEYLFGIEGFNNTPKLIFNDLFLYKKDFTNKKIYFSIDMKNAIDVGENAPESNPRTYQTARRNLEFQGEIQLHKIDLLGEHAGELCEKYVAYILSKFNQGVYRLGNSKSRGYGKIKILEPLIVKDNGEEIK